MMYQIGESVVYGTTGVCNVTAIGPLSMHGVDRHRQYYTLQPVHQEGAVYVPVEGEQQRAIRQPITHLEAETFLQQIPDIEPFQVQGFNYKQRTDAFSTALHENDCVCLVQVIKAVMQKKQNFRERQQYNADNGFLKRAMNLLCGELAFALELPLEETRTLVEAAVQPVQEQIV